MINEECENLSHDSKQIKKFQLDTDHCTPHPLRIEPTKPTIMNPNPTNTDTSSVAQLTGARLTTFITECDRQVRQALEQGTIRPAMRTIAADFVSFKLTTFQLFSLLQNVILRRRTAGEPGVAEAFPQHLFSSNLFDDGGH